jgi:hypothetical protein
MVDDTTLLWFFLGIIAGIAGSFGGLEFFAWIKRPILTSPQTDEDWLRDFANTVIEYRSEATIERQRVAVWRLKIANVGRSAAENARGTLIPRPDDRRGVEQRIPWYEPPRQTITLNRNDHSYLDLFGVRLDSPRPNEICVPVEDGWGGVGRPIQGFDVSMMPRFGLRVTASNCAPLLLEFRIDMAQGCRPELVQDVF